MIMIPKKKKIQIRKMKKIDRGVINGINGQV